LNDLEFQMRKMHQLGEDLTRLLPSVHSSQATTVCDVLNQLELCLQMLERVAKESSHG
jgi:uncharacterized protein YqiB (DUF1249 family)